MSQQVRPDADFHVGGWAPVPLWPQLDEPAPDDTSYVTSPALPPDSSFTVDVTPPAAPIVGPPEDAVQPHALVVRLDGSCCTSAVVALLDTVNGSTRWVKSQLFYLSPGFRNYTLTLSYREAALIEDYTTLQVLVMASAGGSSSSCSCSSSSSSSGSASSSSAGSASSSSASSASSSSAGRASASRSASAGPSRSAGGSAESAASGSSSSGSDSTVSVPCCPNNLPSTLYLTSSAFTEPVPLYYGSSGPCATGPAWQTGLITIDGCGTFLFEVACQADPIGPPIPGQLLPCSGVTFSCVLIFEDVQSMCDPLYITGKLSLSNIGCNCRFSKIPFVITG